MCYLIKFQGLAIASLSSPFFVREHKVAGFPINGTFDFDPGNDFQDLAEDKIREDVNFTYKATDQNGVDSNSNIATVTILVTGVNDNPTLQSGTGDATEDGTAVDIDLSVLGNHLDSDDNGTTLTYAIVGTPVSEGSATINGTTLTFDRS